jgi:glycerophosphoryl diester phosphodiesterase
MKTITGLILALLAATLLPAGAFADLPRYFDVEAHRGGRDARPENTLYSFAYAMALGATTLEMDMQITGDGIIVIRHDNHMLPMLTKNRYGDFITENEMPDIRTSRLADLRTFDIGEMSPKVDPAYWEAHGKTQKAIPGVKLATLEEVFQLVKDWGNNEVFMNIETKSYCYPVILHNPDPYEWVVKFYALVKKYHMEKQVMLQSFDWRTLKIMKELDPSIPTVALTAEHPQWNVEGDEGRYRWEGRKEKSPWMGGLDIKDFQGDYVKAAHAIKADVVSPYYEELTPELVKEAHAFGMTVVPWTIDREEDMRKVIDMGVDGLITDRPSVGRKVCLEKGLKLPAPDAHPEKKPYYTGTDWGLAP